MTSKSLAGAIKEFDQGHCVKGPLKLLPVPSPQSVAAIASQDPHTRPSAICHKASQTSHCGL